MLSRVENATLFTPATPSGPHGSAALDSSLPFQDLSTASSVYISCSHNSNLLVFVNSQTKGSTLDASLQNFKALLFNKEGNK